MSSKNFRFLYEVHEHLRKARQIMDRKTIRDYNELGEAYDKVSDLEDYIDDLALYYNEETELSKINREAQELILNDPYITKGRLL